MVGPGKYWICYCCGLTTSFFLVFLSMPHECLIFGMVWWKRSTRPKRHPHLDKDTRKSVMFYSLTKSIFGKNVGNKVNHAKWRPARKGITPAFAPKHTELSWVICANHMRKWIKECLETAIESGEEIDISTEMLLLTTVVICEAAFDRQVPREKIEEVHHASDKVMVGQLVVTSPYFEAIG